MQDRKDRWTVGQWMTPNPQTISPETSVRSAFFKMRSEGFRHLPVIENGHLVGMVTDRDLRRPDVSNEPDGWHEFYHLDEDYEVRHVMTTRVESMSQTDSVESALKLLIDRKYGAAPVVDKRGDLIGIISTYDLMRAFEEAMSQAGDVLRGG